MMDSQARTIEDLRQTLRNLKRTRQSSAASMHRWCDTLIRDTEAELARLTEEPSAVEHDRGRRVMDSETMAARSTYPLCETAPRQRLL